MQDEKQTKWERDNWEMIERRKAKIEEWNRVAGLDKKIKALEDKIELLEKENKKYRKIIDEWIKGTSDILGYKVKLKGYKDNK